jgi:hypothetical protein
MLYLLRSQSTTSGILFVVVVQMGGPPMNPYQMGFQPQNPAAMAMFQVRSFAAIGYID